MKRTLLYIGLVYAVVIGGAIAVLWHPEWFG